MLLLQESIPVSACSIKSSTMELEWDVSPAERGVFTLGLTQQSSPSMPIPAGSPGTAREPAAVTAGAAAAPAQ